MFEPLTSEIDAVYQRLGYREGWRFLYGPRSTLAPGTKVVFLGLNPGGSGAAAWANRTFIKPEVPEGNAYRVEPGWNTGHQDEVKTLFLRLVEAARIAKSWQRFMDEDVLTSNFCPFRSASWKDLGCSFLFGRG
jgi:hypothetical protein